MQVRIWERLKPLLLAVMLGSLMTAAIAETAQETAVKKLIEPRLGDGVKVDAVAKTPYLGMFEVRVGKDIFYTDAAAKYMFVGRILDAKSSRDYTKERMDEISKVKFSDLPLELAMKSVKGNGKRVIAVFEDPNCGYCKKFRKTLQDVDNVTVYTFMYNILAADSAVKSKNVWCSANRDKAWDDWMLNGKLPATAAASCVATPNDKVLALGQALGVSGTPTIIFADGSRIPGFIDAKALEEKFASVVPAAPATPVASSK
ncbi:DsbC family protein [Glaciimonas sp. CA11.2]|uniref:DsbC family protein n=1 Tax=Glaciimonas sp. CA11.2 TaxID=3048601 RepID=UPI002AB34201|nr:DsbC family protein [Glaciimonas sp. CA11.2]MDY7545647.1 DsbC family protein [Glaciimonas sp. CA11.2]MEB0162666.1 DsbC family protein [Glaciimonas sp. CA11.2]